MKPIYILDRGYLNSIAVYSLGMLASLISMLRFRKKNKFKVSEEKDYYMNYDRLKNLGLDAVYLSGFLIIGSCYLVFWNTFPDAIAVFNPFKSKLSMRGITPKESFLIFSISFILIIALVKNSLHFTGPMSNSFRAINEFSKVSFSLNLIKSDYYASYATIIPLLVFFSIIAIAYELGNAFGIILVYLGCILFSQITQFFKNFKNLHFFYIGILMAGKTEVEKEKEIEGLDDNFSDLMHFCRFYGKFSTGVSLFIHKVMCFSILLDSFNMHIVDHITLIRPYNLTAIMLACIAIQIFISLDHICASKYVRFALHRIHQLMKKDIEDPSFQPPVDEINRDLFQVSFMSEFFMLFLPVNKYFNH